MKRYRFERDPVVWLIFAAAVGVPSLEFAKLRRARDGARPPVAPPQVQPSGRPRIGTPAPTPVAPPALPATPAPPAPAGSPPRAPTDPVRYVPIGATKTPIAASVRSAGGRVAAVLEESGRVSVWNLEAHAKLSSFAAELPSPLLRAGGSPSMSLMDPSANHGPGGPPPQPALLAIGSADGNVRIWNATTGEKLLMARHRSREQSAGALNDLAVVDVAWSSPTFAASVASDGTLATWFPPGGADSALVSNPLCPGGAVRAIDASSEHEVIALACARGVYVVPVMGYRWTAVDTAGVRPEGVWLSPTGRLVAAGSGGGEIRVYSIPVVRNWDPNREPNAAALEHAKAPPRRVRTMRFPGGSAPRLLAFSSDGELLAAAAGTGRTIYVWPVKPGAKPVALTLPRGPVRSLWFAPHGRTLVVAGMGDRFFHAWDLAGSP